jgi:hypothetical protein
MPSSSLQAMAALTDHPYASLTLPDDAASDCLFLRPGLPGATPFLLHRGGGDLPNSQEVREGKTAPPTRESSLSFPVGERRGPSSEAWVGPTGNWLEGGCGSVIKTSLGSSLQALQKLSDVTLVPVSCSELEKAGAGLSSLCLVLSTRPHC